MTEFRKADPNFAVAGQINVEDVGRAATEGYRTLIVNRPENEDPGQLSHAEIAAAAKAAGLKFHVLPFTGPPPPAIVAETAEILEAAQGPVLAYCRTGRRSIMAWAMAQALTGARSPAELIEMAGKAGYDLEGARPALETLAPRN